jgi:3-hydroxyacyl-[acyl-carrier-protein] dehydratase/UDP-3-O-[3-hydroxymyristoyl] N-acetylglucosamine deacetylase/3-hydroxyacyl-[acyl-carrier-protein] dehydratase
MPQKPEATKIILDIEKIQGMLPHRYPFLLIDRILEFKKGKSLIALKNVTCNEPFFLGHFPKYKVMPGVLIIEAIAQTGGVLLYDSLPEPETKLVFLSKINNAKFRRPVVPGDQLILEIELLKLKKNFACINGKAFVDDQIVAEAEIMASILKFEELHGK